MLEFDPIANIFPLIEGQARDDFRADIDAQDLREEIMLLKGRVLDGRNRYLALLHLEKVDPNATPEWLLANDSRFLDFENEHPGVDPFDWVMSLNVHRRHLEPSQWAAVAANAEQLKHGGVRRGADQDAKLQPDRAKLSTTFNVSPRLIASAAKVKREGAPELFAAVEQGKVKATVAEGLLTLPKNRQAEAATALDARKLPTLAKRAKRAEREKHLAVKQRALPDKIYGVIYLDPATRFLTRSEIGDSRQPEYPTMTIEEIKALPVGTLAAPDCAILCWTTGPQLDATLGILRFWGFKYVAQCTWDKTGSETDATPAPPGTGFWFRNDHELLILATRGNPPCPAPGDNWSSVHREKKTGHSVKPLHYTLMIESYFPNLPKLEMFKRGEARPGWDYWGNEAPESDATAIGIPALADEGDEAEAAQLAYQMALEKVLDRRGKLVAAEAATALRFGREAKVSPAQLAVDLGHPLGTIKTWLNKLGLTSLAHMEAMNAERAAKAAARRSSAEKKGGS